MTSLPASRMPSRCASPTRDATSTTFERVDVRAFSMPASRQGSRQGSRTGSPLRTRLSQKHTFAASLKTAGREDYPAKPACAVHAYQLDFSSIRKNSAIFGTSPRGLESDEPASSLSSARSTARSSTEGSPRSDLLLSPTYNSIAKPRKHAFAATLSRTGRDDSLEAPACPIHCYSGLASERLPMAGTFGRAVTPRGLLVPIDGPRQGFLRPDYDSTFRRGSFNATFGRAARPDSTMAVGSSRTGLAPAPPSRGNVIAGAATARPTTSRYLKAKIDNQYNGVMPTPPPSRGTKRLATVSPRSIDEPLEPMHAAPIHRPLEAAAVGA